MFFGDKAPGFDRLNTTQQLYANTVHLRGMKQISLALPLLFERDRSGMEALMTRFAQRQEIRFLIASLLASEDDVMDFESSIL